MKKILISLLIVTQIVFVSAKEALEEIRYDMIAEAKSKRVGEYLYRYYWILGSNCMGYIDSIGFAKDAKGDDVSPTDWAIYKTKALCELNGKTIATDFTDAHIVDVEFKENSIHLLISMTHLRKPGEERQKCTINITDGEFSDLICEESERVDR